MENLKGKVAIVTGASRGIGRGISIELAKEGALVVINYSKDLKGAEETLRLINSIGGYGKIIKGDISNFDECSDIVNETLKSLGKIDILINNAGRSEIGLFMDATKESIDNLIGVNLFGAMYMTKNVLNHMISRGEGNIINISSIWGDVGASCEVVYSTSKGGLNLFTKSLAKEVSSMGIRVNGIAPGVIETEMNSFLTIDERKELEDEIPMGRFGEVSEIGKAITFLCSENCKYLNGQIIKIDGAFI